MCTNFFRYDTDYLKFGKIDISRFPEAAKKFNINDASLSRQLPTVIMFKNGVEEIRRPLFDSKGKVFKFFFTEVCTYSTVSEIRALIVALYAVEFYRIRVLFTEFSIIFPHISKCICWNVLSVYIFSTPL